MRHFVTMKLDETWIHHSTFSFDLNQMNKRHEGRKRLYFENLEKKSTFGRDSRESGKTLRKIRFGELKNKVIFMKLKPLSL